MKKLIYSKQFPELDGPDVSGEELFEAFSEVVEKTKNEFMFVHICEVYRKGKKVIPYPENET